MPALYSEWLGSLHKVHSKSTSIDFRLHCILHVLKDVLSKASFRKHAFHKVINLF